MTTGYEVKMYHDIGAIAQALNRIANCLEAAEQRARRREEFTPEEMEALAPAIAAVRRGFADLERAVREEGGDGGDHPA